MNAYLYGMILAFIYVFLMFPVYAQGSANDSYDVYKDARYKFELKNLEEVKRCVFNDLTVLIHFNSMLLVPNSYSIKSKVDSNVILMSRNNLIKGNYRGGSIEVGFYKDNLPDHLANINMKVHKGNEKLLNEYGYNVIYRDLILLNLYQVIIHKNGQYLAIVDSNPMLWKRILEIHDFLKHNSCSEEP